MLKHHRHHSLPKHLFKPLRLPRSFAQQHYLFCEIINQLNSQVKINEMHSHEGKISGKNIEIILKTNMNPENLVLQLNSKLI